ncbi:DUF1127 domain-containing protein [Mesorhizobium sp. CAU 1732]|uniref:DUF1127 domain-containing protein n=1 Tax=Mesorhizobium sp. CAU 1732 TaxID=3140358 RepID=UPI00326051B3
MSTIDTIKEVQSRQPVLRRLARWMFSLMGRYDLAAERYRSRAALRELNDSQLKDIGLTRREAVREGTRAFWD